MPSNQTKPNQTKSDTLVNNVYAGPGVGGLILSSYYFFVWRFVYEVSYPSGFYKYEEFFSYFLYTVCSKRIKTSTFFS